MLSSWFVCADTETSLAHKTISRDDHLWGVHYEIACNSALYHVSDMLIHMRDCWSLAFLDVIVSPTLELGALYRAIHHQVFQTVPQEMLRKATVALMAIAMHTPMI